MKKNNNILILMALLFSAVGLQATNALTPKKYHLEEIHFISTYKNVKNKKEGQDIYLTLEWRLNNGTHPKQTTDHTISPNKFHKIKSPGIGYYLNHVNAVPSVLMTTGLVATAFSGSTKAGGNRYFEIYTGDVPKGSQNSKVEIHGYKHKADYDLAHPAGAIAVGPNPIIAPVTQTKADKKASRKTATPLVGPNQIVNGAAPAVVAPIATATNNNNNVSDTISAAANHSASVSAPAAKKKDKKDKKDKKQAQVSAAHSNVASAAASHSASASAPAAKKDKKKK